MNTNMHVNRRRMKRTVAFVLCFITLFSVLSFADGTVFQTVIQSQAAGTILSGNCGKSGSNLKWELNENGDLIISGRGEMKDYSYEVPPWATELKEQCILEFGCDAEESLAYAISKKRISLMDVATAFVSCAKAIGGRVIIKEGVTSISDYAFSEWRASSLQLPSTLKTIGEGAFLNNCLTTVRIPEGVETIQEDAFGGNPLRSIEFPKSLKSLGKGAVTSARLEKILFQGNPVVANEAICILCRETGERNPFSDVNEYRKFYRVYDAIETIGWMDIVLQEQFEKDVDEYYNEYHSIKEYCTYDYAQARIALDYLWTLAYINAEFHSFCPDFDEMSQYLVEKLEDELDVRISSSKAVVKFTGRLDDGTPTYGVTGGLDSVIEEEFGDDYDGLWFFGSMENLSQKSTTHFAAPWIEISAKSGTVGEKLAKNLSVRFTKLPDDSANTEPVSSEASSGCPWCGGKHTGLIGGIIAFFHSVLAGIFGVKY